MKEKEKNSELDSSLSLSKQRKIQRKKEIARQKRQAKINKIIAIVVIAAIVIGIGSYGGYKIYLKANEVKESTDYSKYLDENGFVKNVTAKDKINLCDYKNINVPLSDVEYTDESVDKDINQALEDHKVLNKQSTAAIADGDKVNIDFVGKIDGKEFEGGSSDGKGYDLTIGSKSFIDGFEDQLIGHKAGEKMVVNVTFPASYQNAEVAGKDAVFDVTINGLYEKGVFNDEFVKTNFSDKASTVEEYKKYLKDTNYDTNLTKWLTNYLQKESKVKSYPEDYLKHLARTLKQDDLNMFNSMNSYLSSMGGSAYKTFKDYVGKSMDKYYKELRKRAKTTAKENLVYQAILESEGVTVTEADYKKYSLGTGTTEDVYKQQIDLYGTGYSVQKYVKEKALEIVKGLVTVK